MTKWFVRAWCRRGEDDIVVTFRSRLALVLWLTRNIGRYRYLSVFSSDYYDGYV